jgi:oxygen-independent coproporphyrinogen-3 oxidase
VKALDRGEIPFEKEILTTEDKVNEYILTSLRTQWGTNLKELYSLYKYDLVKDHQAYLTTLFEKGLAAIDTDVLTLTRKGKFLADKISSDLFLLPA